MSRKISMPSSTATLFKTQILLSCTWSQNEISSSFFTVCWCSQTRSNNAFPKSNFVSVDIKVKWVVFTRFRTHMKNMFLHYRENYRKLMCSFKVTFRMKRTCRGEGGCWGDIANDSWQLFKANSPTNCRPVICMNYSHSLPLFPIWSVLTIVSVLTVSYYQHDSSCPVTANLPSINHQPSTIMAGSRLYQQQLADVLIRDPPRQERRQGAHGALAWNRW